MSEHVVDFMPPAVRIAGDTIAAAGIISTLVGLLPAIAAGFGIIWYCILIWDRLDKWREERAKKKAGGAVPASDDLGSYD
jgi:hypothetical protein